MATPTSNPDPETPPTPRWVKMFGIVAILLVAAFIVLHLTCGGLRHHQA